MKYDDCFICGGKVRKSTEQPHDLCGLGGVLVVCTECGESWFTNGVRVPTREEFLSILPAIRAAARTHGYAVGLHGSLKRDFDLVAVPWTKDAGDPDAVAEAIRVAAGCVRWRVFRGQGKLSGKHQDDKPHGRLTYAFDWDRRNHENSGYIDLSVMPRVEKPKP